MSDRTDIDREVREKLIEKGVAALSSAELLSILFQKGEGSMAALDLAERLLAGFGGSLSSMAKCAVPELRVKENLGIRRAAIVAAAFELGHREQSERADKQEIIRTDQDVITMFRPLLVHLPHEEFWVIYLNTANRVVDRVRISQGGVAETVVDVRLVMKRAIVNLARGIVLVHNHPSGSAQPSRGDVELTRKIADAAALFDILLVDHVIIAEQKCFSFREHALLEREKASKKEV